LKILLVDDEADIRTVARISLRQLAGFTVLEAGSGAEALAIAATETLDAIVLDVMMPDIDGPAVLAALRRDPRTATIPVVFLTAKAMPDEVSRLQKLGAAGIYTKPFNPAEFAAAMRAVVMRDRPGATSSAPLPGPAAAARIDTRALGQLVGLTTDQGTDLIGALIDLFEVNTVTLIDRIKALPADGAAAAEVERAAHTLKAGASTLGAIEIADLARTIEHAARDGRRVDVASLLGSIHEQLAPTIVALRAERVRALGHD
jgi:two-component system OmpR family response regulator